MLREIFDTLRLWQDPAERREKVMAPVVQKLQELADQTGGALEVKVLKGDEDFTVSLSAPDAEAFPSDTEYLHTRDTDPVRAQDAFTITAVSHGKDVYATATSHDHERMRQSGRAMFNLEERIPDFEGFADGTLFADKMAGHATDFACRVLPEGVSSKLAHQSQAPKPHKPGK